MTARSDLLTVIAAGAAAYAGADVVHEVLGHVGMCLLTGVKFTVISTIGVTTAGASRWVAAAGTVANILAGTLAFAAYRSRRRFDATTYFLWLFGAVNLMNVGYLIFSSVTGGSDWGVVVRGLPLQLLWRIGMGIAGYFAYRFVMLTSARLLAERVAPLEIGRLTWPAYFTGAVVMTAASFLNPQGTRYILISGVGGSLGLTVGLIRVPSLVRKRFAGENHSAGMVGRSVGWIVAGALSTAIFVGIIGPGIHVG